MASKRQQPVRRRRRFLFRAAAVCLGLLPFVVVELVLVGLGWADPALDEDPYVGFHETRPLFVLNQASRRFEIPSNRLMWFCEDSFPAEKSADEFRIFCLGGSTVQGRPFAIQTAFSKWLEINLQLADSSRSWRVVNCGGVSYASYRLANITKQVLQHSPDLIVLYTGHNEFLEDRSYSHLRDRAAWLRSLHQLAAKSRLYSLTARSTRGWFSSHSNEQATKLGADVYAWLDEPDGIKNYRRDPEWRRKVMEHYAFNVRRILAICRKAKVPVVLVNPASNLRDTPPFKALHRSDISKDDMRRWDDLVRQARQAYGVNFWKATSLYEKARRIDGQHAGLLYDLAKCYERIGQIDKAREAYIAAKDNDICPLRMLEAMHESLLQTARQTRTPLVDARQIIESVSPNAMPGNFMMLDHVHPSMPGHQKIADALFAVMRSQGWVSPATNWRDLQAKAFEDQVKSLDKSYFVRGLARLEGLKKWAGQRRDPSLEPTAK